MRTMLSAVVAVMLSTAMFAQTPTPAPAPGSQAPVPAPPPASPRNVRYDITITDSGGAGVKPLTKTVSLNVIATSTQGSSGIGQIRSSVRQSATGSSESSSTSESSRSVSPAPPRPPAAPAPPAPPAAPAPPAVAAPQAPAQPAQPPQPPQPFVFVPQEYALDVDVNRPTLISATSVRTPIVVHYQPAPTAGVSGGNVRISVDMILEDGRRTLLSQTADPVTDRRVSIEVTATIGK